MSLFLAPGRDFIEDLYAEGLGYRTIAVVQSHDYDAGGRLYDTLEVTFELTDHPGTFTASAPYTPDSPGDWRGPINALADALNAIYAL